MWDRNQPHLAEWQAYSGETLRAWRLCTMPSLYAAFMAEAQHMAGRSPTTQNLPKVMAPASSGFLAEQSDAATEHMAGCGSSSRKIMLHSDQEGSDHVRGSGVASSVR